MKRIVYALCLISALGAVIAGCGSSSESAGGAYSGGNDGGSEGKQASDSEPIGIAVVSSKKVDDLGKVLVDSEGRTLYDFQNDKHSLYSAFSSACYGACAENWPPLLTEGEPEAEGGAFPTKSSTLQRKDGTLQVTYYGHPLYTYVGDKKPGEANGNEVTAFGGKWYVSRPAG